MSDAADALAYCLAANSKADVKASQELQKTLNGLYAHIADKTARCYDDMILKGVGILRADHEYEVSSCQTVTFDKAPAAGDQVYISGTTTVSDEEFWAGKQWTPQQKKFVCHGKLSDEQVWKTGDGWNIGAPVKPFSDKCISFYKLPSVIICAAEDVANLQRHYGSGYEVRAA